MSLDQGLSAEDLFERGMTARRERRLADALHLLLQALAAPRGELGRKHRRHAYHQALKSSTRLSLWPETEALARRAIGDFPTMAYFHQCQGEALMQLGRADEARIVLDKALELRPEQDGARALLQALRSGDVAARATTKPRPWPTRQTSFASPRELVIRYMLRDRPKAPFIRPDTVFMTLGSCFADNLAQRLRVAGYATFSERIGEEVNSTFANRYLLEWIESGPVNPQTTLMDETFGGASRERLRCGIEACDVFVMTLGVAASFFDDEGEFVFISQHSQTTAASLGLRTMRTTSVAENVENISRIVGAVWRIAGRKVKIVLTVSPVPLAGTSEMESAVTADCLSKSTLRVACQEAIAKEPAGDLIYWPSFEMVRWLGPHFGPETPPVYAADDGNTRHVSAWLIDLIVGLFVEFHAATDA